MLRSCVDAMISAKNVKGAVIVEVVEMSMSEFGTCCCGAGSSHVKKQESGVFVFMCHDKGRCVGIITCFCV